MAQSISIRGKAAFVMCKMCHVSVENTKILRRRRDFIEKRGRLKENKKVKKKKKMMKWKI